MNRTDRRAAERSEGAIHITGTYKKKGTLYEMVKKKMAHSGDDIYPDA